MLHIHPAYFSNLPRSMITSIKLGRTRFIVNGVFLDEGEFEIDLSTSLDWKQSLLRLHLNRMVYNCVIRSYSYWDNEKEFCLDLDIYSCSSLEIMIWPGNGFERWLIHTDARFTRKVGQILL